MPKANKKVVYYPGCFANYWAPEIGKAMVQILEKSGLEVIVPRHRCCGAARVGYGDLAGARSYAARLVKELYPLADRGYDIVTACPSCSLALKEEYPFLLTGEGVKMVSERIIFWSRYLRELDAKGRFEGNFNRTPLFVPYHAPCHLKAQHLEGDSVKLMSLVPGLQVIELDRGCCGMAGTSGFKRRCFDSSMEIGGALFAQIRELNATRVATDCGACQMQIEQATNVETLHPLVILDQAQKQ